MGIFCPSVMACFITRTHDQGAETCLSRTVAEVPPWQDRRKGERYLYIFAGVYNYEWYFYLECERISHQYSKSMKTQEAWHILGDVEKRARYDWLAISKEFQGQMSTQNSRYNAQLANSKFDSEQDAALAATFGLEDLAEIEDGSIGLQCRCLALLVTLRVKCMLLTQVWGNVSRRKVRYRGSSGRVRCSSRLWYLFLTDFGCQQMTSADNKSKFNLFVTCIVLSVKERHL